MLSVIIATHDSERTLMPTLAALVPGAMTGLVSDVVVADGGSQDDTEVVAEHAGCNFMMVEGALALRLNRPAKRRGRAGSCSCGRAPCSMRLGLGDTQRFVERPANTGTAAVFRRGDPARAGLRDALSLLAATLGKRPSPEQGLLIAKPLYTSLGGHSTVGRRPRNRFAAADRPAAPRHPAKPGLQRGQRRRYLTKSSIWPKFPYMPALPQQQRRVAAVRSFNRFYTRQIGVLRKNFLDSPYTLGEARVLYEIGRRRLPTASDIGRELDLDAGYLSRVLRNFEKSGLIERTASASDARRSYLALRTMHGKSRLARRVRSTMFGLSSTRPIRHD